MLPGPAVGKWRRSSEVRKFETDGLKVKKTKHVQRARAEKVQRNIPLARTRHTPF